MAQPVTGGAAGVDTQLQNQSIRVERKHFTFDLRENPRGRFLRIIEEVNGRRDAIIIPLTGIEDFRDQLRQVRKMGPLEQVLGMLPKVGPLANLPKDTQVDESRLTRVEAVINSMTASERADHNLLDGKRRKRIARGSGTTVQDVNQVVKQYLQMRQMVKQYGSLAAKGKLRGMGGGKPPGLPS